MYRSVRTALLPETAGSEKGIVSYRCCTPHSRRPPHQFSFCLRIIFFLLLCFTEPVSSSKRAHLFLMTAHYSGNLPPLWLLRKKKCPPGCFSYRLSTIRGFLRVLLQDNAVLQLVASCVMAQRLRLWLASYFIFSPECREQHLSGLMVKYCCLEHLE